MDLHLTSCCIMHWDRRCTSAGDSAGEERTIASRQLQPYRILLRAIRGRDNVEADCLSQNPLDDDPVE